MKPNSRRRELELLAANDKYDHVPCERCGAQYGEPCRSCMGNTTMPHTARVQAAKEAR